MGSGMAVERKLKKYYIWIIMLVALLARVIYIWGCPAGIHADEAFAGYEAWSLANYGMDSAGYTYPVYLTVWGGGMSVMNSLLMIPFVKLFGLNTVTVKLPAVIMGILSVYIFYLLLKKAANERLALWGSFLLAISPWHIMISRYGMDANLAPAFVLIAMYLTALGIEDNRKLVLAGLAWGISLYSYVVLWIFVPIFLLLALIYCIKRGKITDYRCLVPAALVLLVIALPLLLFVCVNMGWMNEIRIGAISIPRLAWFRTDEFTENGGVILNIKRLIKCFVLQSDGYMWNSIPVFGIYYIFSTPISAVGLYAVAKQALADRKQKKFGFSTLLLIWLFAAVVMAFTQTTGTNLTRINPINPAMFILVAVGIVSLIDLAKRHLGSKKAAFRLEPCAVAVYALCFVCFMGYYFTVYNEDIALLQIDGAKEALECANDLLSGEEYGDTIYVTGQLRHSQVLFYTQLPTDEYVETVVYNGVVNR